ncbi:MAG: PQQ-dependent sugar dehydrogenase [Acidobacteriota bacterium]
MSPSRAAAARAGSLFLASVCALLALPTASKGQPPSDLRLETFGSGFTSPVAIRHAGDGTDRLFVVEQAGLIKIVVDDSSLATPFLDLRGLVESGGETGLLGLAFHPDYESNGLFYVNYTRLAPDLETVVARYSASAEDPNVADPASATEILVVAQPFGNHNGGDIHFSPVDGYLYVGMGDGGGFDTPQDMQSLLGKMLRLDVDGGTPYAIPADNPFVDDAGARDEIWASGLRNPWRWSFDRSTGDLLIGDVGEGSFEEMNFAAAGVGGLNFGWPCREGNADFQPAFCTGGETLTPPFYEIPRSTGACSVIGGYVYRGNNIPSLGGWVMFHDWCSGETFFGDQTSPGVWSVEQWEDIPGFNSVGYGEDEDGELYMTFGEELARLVSPSGAGLIFESDFDSGLLDDWSTQSP